MIEQDNSLSLQETEQLCEFFMNCKLSVLQENELRYVLTQLDHHSPLIDETRTLMGIELSAFDKPHPISSRIGKRWWNRKSLYFSIAASIALIVGLGVSFLRNSTSGFATPGTEYIAYVNGHRLDKEAAITQVEADILLAESILKEMSDREEMEKNLIDNFFNK